VTVTIGTVTVTTVTQWQ